MERVFKTRISGPKGLLSLSGVLCLALGMMVFAWGTGYKLSLYNPGHESFPAKVCTRGSDAAKSALEKVAATSAMAENHLRIAALLFPPQVTEFYSFDRPSDVAVSALSPLSRAPILYLRPPPDKGRSLG